MRIEIIFLLDLYHTEFLPNIIKSPADTEPCWNGRGMRGEGGGGGRNPLCKLHSYGQYHRVWFFSHFALKMCRDFIDFRLKC